MSVSKIKDQKWPEASNYKLYSNMEEKVLLRLGKGMTREEISKDLNITRTYVRVLIARIKIKRNKN